MADPISTYALDTTKVDVKANTYCRRIAVKENYDSDSPPTANLVQYEPTGSSTPAKIVKGAPAVFTSQSTYSPGEVVGGIKTSAGSITVQQIESWRI